MQFSEWFKEATEVEKAVEPNMMCISTVGLDGFPNSRYVLLKEVSQGGFVFFTNYESEKAREIANLNQVALNFYWPTPNRQVRVRGSVTKVDVKESDEYFLQRPIKSQAGAIASRQSTAIPLDKTTLVQEVTTMADDAEAGKIKLQRPEYWGGYRVMPRYFEFWQGERNRCHDRFVYIPGAVEGTWDIKRLAP